jgi:hypothetical protein
VQDREALAADYGSLVQKLLDRLDIQDTISRYSLGQDSHQGKVSNILQRAKQS